MTEFDNAVETIKTKYSRVLERNKCLQNENDHLRSEYYKDDELAAMKESTMKLNWRINHYGLEEEDWNELINWWKDHSNKEDVFHPLKMKSRLTYTIHISEFPECTCYSLVCDRCGECHDVYL